MLTIRIVLGDITREECDAVVNAANSSLMGGGGVDGAIHRAAGPELAIECRMLNGCKTGQAKMTKGYLLPARHIIHTVGPVWRGGGFEEDAFLASCYRNCYRIAKEQGFATIAFPAISTGIYGFPVERATRIARAETESLPADAGNLREVRFICFDRQTLHIYRDIFAGLYDVTS